MINMFPSRASGTTLHLGGHHPRTVLSQDRPWLVFFQLFLQIICMLWLVVLKLILACLFGH